MRFSALFTSVLSLSVIYSVAQPCYAKGYFSVRGGINDVKESAILEKRTNDNFISVALGTNTGPFRMEGEYSYLQPVEFKTPKIKARFQRAMAQGYIDLPVTRYVQPYLNAGAGASFYHVSGFSASESATNFAWNIGGGVGFRLTRNLTADTGLRYVDMGKADLKDAQKKLDFSSFESYVGLRFLF